MRAYFINNDKSVVSGDYDGNIYIWNIQTCVIEGHINNDGNLWCMTVFNTSNNNSGDNICKYIACGHSGGNTIGCINVYKNNRVSTQKEEKQEEKKEVIIISDARLYELLKRYECESIYNQCITNKISYSTILNITDNHLEKLGIIYVPLYIFAHITPPSHTFLCDIYLQTQNIYIQCVYFNFVFLLVSICL